jgi:hypothetical protein
MEEERRRGGEEEEEGRLDTLYYPASLERT